MMLPLLAFAACFESLFCGHVSGFAANDYTLYFRSQGVSQYSNIWGMPSLTEFTVCLWMKATAQPGSLFSYAVSAHHNEILLYKGYNDGPNFDLWIGMDNRPTTVSANDGNWHHICASWKNTGDWQFYKDGVLATSGTGFKTGYTVQSGGSLMLAQEQDSVGGSLVVSESFKGMLANVNVWDRVLTKCEINVLLMSCLAGEGNVYKWADFIHGVKGNTAVSLQPALTPLNG